MKIAILLYEGLTLLDAIGPYDALRHLPGAEVRFVAEQPGPKRPEDGSIALVAEHALDELSDPEIVVVPGGSGQSELMHEGPVLEWLRCVHRTSTWTTSVCTGSLLLGAAGLLAGRRATSHWLALEELGTLGATPTAERVVFDGKIVTAAGVSAGIDMALALAARIAGGEVARAIQLGMEYDPQPPFDSGSPQKAPPRVVQLLRSRSRFAPRHAARPDTA
jgi:transcriptional regulator GlxA family with amidase domain